MNIEVANKRVRSCFVKWEKETYLIRCSANKIVAEEGDDFAEERRRSGMEKREKKTISRYVWGRIYTSQVFVNFGTRWKIEDDTNINVWKDPWVKGGSNLFITSTVVSELESLTINSLFNVADGLWNTHVLSQLFNKEDQVRIMGISLRCREGEDSLIWNQSCDGLYSVKSAYYSAMYELVDSTDS